jgi:hypothetical protein
VNALERRVQDQLVALLHGTHDTDLLDTASISTFADDEVLTDNAGLVLTLDDGAELQLTIVQSRTPRSNW